MTSALSVQVLAQAEELRAIEHAWDELAARDDAADVFGSFDWVFTWWEHFQQRGPDVRLPLHPGQRAAGLRVQSSELHVIIVRSGTRLLALLPLVRVAVRWRRMPVRVLMPPIGAHAPRSSWPCAADAPRAMRAVLEHLRQDSRWDVLWLEGLPRHAFTHAAFARAAHRAQLRSARAPAWGHSLLYLDDSWEEFQKERGSHFRKRLARSERELAGIGPVRAHCYHGPDAVVQGMQTFLQIDADSWKAELGESIGLDAGLGSHYSSLALRLARKDACEIWTLEVGGEAAAAFLCLRKGNALYTLKTSYRRRFSSPAYSTGAVLLYRILEDAFRRKLQALDFVGRIPFSERWTSQLTEFEPTALFRTRRFPRVARALDRSAELAAHWGLVSR